MEWQTKAHQLVYEMCTAASLHANTKRDGTRYRKQRPYTVPPLAQELVECLSQQDEERAKAIFLHIATGMPREYTRTLPHRNIPKTRGEDACHAASKTNVTS